jgi:hypothetical protein
MAMFTIKDNLTYKILAICFEEKLAMKFLSKLPRYELVGGDVERPRYAIEDCCAWAHSSDSQIEEALEQFRQNVNDGIEERIRK